MNFANGQYINAYKTFIQELEYDTGDKTLSFTQPIWRTYTSYTRLKLLTVIKDQAVPLSI